MKELIKFEARVYGKLKGGKGTYVALTWREGSSLKMRTLCFDRITGTIEIKIDGNLYSVTLVRSLEKRKVLVYFIVPYGGAHKCEVTVKEKSSFNFPAAGINRAEDKRKSS